MVNDDFHYTCKDQTDAGACGTAVLGPPTSLMGIFVKKVSQMVINHQNFYIFKDVESECGSPPTFPLSFPSLRFLPYIIIYKNEHQKMNAVKEECSNSRSVDICCNYYTCIPTPVFIYYGVSMLMQYKD